MEENKNNENQKDYTIGEFVKIAEHIEDSETAFILATTFDEERLAKVLMTTKGTVPDIVQMIVECMLKEPRVSQLIQSSYLSYIETAYHENYDWLIPAFFKFCEVAEPIVNIPRTRISFCSDFVAGLWQQKIEVSYKSLIEGIEWYNKCIDSEK